jgi:tetratricopeptide (TPR) repeat protein
MRCTITAMLLLAALGTATAAPSEADRLFEQGRSLAEDGNYEAACVKFTRAFDLDPAAGIGLNLADCLEHLGDLTTAWRRFQEAATRWDHDGDPRRAKYARDRAVKVARRLATVVIGVPDPGIAGLTIRLGQREVVPAAEIREVIAPGSLELVARAPGKAPFTRTRRVSAGETVVIELALTDAAAPNTDDADDAGGPRRTRVRLAIGLGAVGAAGLLGSLGVSVYGSRKYDDAVATYCDKSHPPVCRDGGAEHITAAQEFTTIGTRLAIAGGALALASAIVYFTAPRGVTVAPVTTAALTGVAISARF